MNTSDLLAKDALEMAEREINNDDYAHTPAEYVMIIRGLAIAYREQAAELADLKARPIEEDIIKLIESERDHLRAESTVLAESIGERDGLIKKYYAALRAVVHLPSHNPHLTIRERLESVVEIALDALRENAVVKDLIITDTNGQRCAVCGGQDNDFEGMIHADGCQVEGGEK